MKRVNMTFDKDESERIQQLMEYYGIKQLTELVRFAIKMQYNRMLLKPE